jgi:hypothetical protein
MTEPVKYNTVSETTQMSEFDEISEQLHARDRYLTRQLVRMRIVVRILDFIFGFADPDVR